MMHLFIAATWIPNVKSETVTILWKKFVVSDWKLLQTLMMSCEDSAEYKEGGDDLDKQIEKADNKKLKEVKMR